MWPPVRAGRKEGAWESRYSVKKAGGLGIPLDRGERRARHAVRAGRRGGRGAPLNRGERRKMGHPVKTGTKEEDEAPR